MNISLPCALPTISTALCLLPAPTPLLPPEAPIVEASVVESFGPDLVALLLQDKRSADTRRAYASDLRAFFLHVDEFSELSPPLVHRFIAQPAPAIAVAMLGYKSAMLARGLSEATVNRRLAAIKSLLKFAHRLGLCETDGRNTVDGEKARAYRDTRGVDVKTLKKLLAAPQKLHTEKPLRLLRDIAILGLLIENALRRAELCKLDVADFDPERMSLWIMGKGRGNQKERVTLSPSCAQRVGAYLQLAGNADGALFRNFDHRPEHAGARLTPDGLYGLVSEYGRAIGLKRLTPHRLRHSAITAALDATKGDVRRVQKLSRHSRLETLMIYDDARNDMQGEVSGLLSGLLK